MIAFGLKVKDRHTGFEGIVVARCEYENGCVSYQVQPLCLDVAELPKAVWLDEQRLVTDASGDEEPKSFAPTMARRGGPQDTPPPFATPPDETYDE